MAFTQGICDVCDRDREIGVASLPFAPMSVAFCRECLTQRAYPLWSLLGLIDMCGGPDEVAAWVHDCKAFKAGVYIEWEAIVRLHQAEPPVSGN